MAPEADPIDDALRPLLRGMWSFESAPPELLRLGLPALERLLVAHDSVFWASYMEARDYGYTRQHGIAAFAKVDMKAVLAAMKRRKWPAVRVALSGIGLVQDPRVVPFLVRAYADPGPPVRAQAIAYLANQRDPVATATVARALRDRSTEVKLAAVRALGCIGDPSVVGSLRAMAARRPSAKLLAEAIKEALAQLGDAPRETP